MRVTCLACAVALLVSAPDAAAQTPAAEDVARRQLESGRAFARQGNYEEALRDFQAVAATHAGTSVADDAWLELARYYVDVAGNRVEAQAAVDAILTGYATSDSAPSAYVIAGRLAMAESRTAEALDTALANFDRVSRLFPDSDAVPDALRLAGEAQFLAGRLDAALASLGRVTSEYPTHPAAADAYLTTARVLVALGDPILAMEELQQARNRFPDAPAAAAALDRLTLLHRLYIRVANGPMYTLTGGTAGPARLENVLGLATLGDGRVIWAAEGGVGLVAPEGAAAPSYVGRPRGLALDTMGRMVVLEGNILRTADGEGLLLTATEGGSPDALENLVTAGQLSTGEWVVMDNDERSLYRFSRDGQYVAPFQSARVTRLAVSENDRVAGIDRDGRDVFIFNAGGQIVSQIQLRTEVYDLRDAEALTFDAYGHLYVLDRNTLAVFTPYGDDAAAGRLEYRLLTLFSLTEGQPGYFDRGLALAIDAAGTAYIYDDRTKRIQVYR